MNDRNEGDMWGYRPVGLEEHKDDTEGRYYGGVCSSRDMELEAFLSLAESFFAELPPGGIWVEPRQSPPQPRIPAGVLKDVAFQAKEVPSPVISHNPDPTAVTGLKTWMWATAGSLDEFVVRAEAAWADGVEFAEVRVSPGPLQLRAPGADPVDCPDSGTVYDTSVSDSRQDTDCYLTFLRSSARQSGGTTLVTASTVWTASWTGTGVGSPQVLPSTPVSSSFRLPVAEVQSVVVSG